MAIHPQSRRVLQILAAGGTPIYEMTGAEGRAHYDKVLLENNPISIEVARSEDFDIPGPAGPIGARSYVPLGLDDSQPPAALVFYHGGGWVIGSIAQPRSDLPRAGQGRSLRRLLRGLPTRARAPVPRSRR